MCPENHSGHTMGTLRKASARCKRLSAGVLVLPAECTWALAGMRRIFFVALLPRFSLLIGTVIVTALWRAIAWGLSSETKCNTPADLISAG